MGDASDAGAVLAQKRWGATRPRRLAEELALRADELPAADRLRLLEALQRKVAQR
jgi:hypothetical protein